MNPRQDFIFGVMVGFLLAMVILGMVIHKPGPTMHEWCEEIREVQPNADGP